MPKFLKIRDDPNHLRNGAEPIIAEAFWVLIIPLVCLARFINGNCTRAMMRRAIASLIVGR